MRHSQVNNRWSRLTATKYMNSGVECGAAGSVQGHAMTPKFTLERLAWENAPLPVDAVLPRPSARRSPAPTDRKYGCSRRLAATVAKPDACKVPVSTF